MLFKSQCVLRCLFFHAGPAAVRRVALVIGEAPMAHPVTDAVAEAWQRALGEKSFVRQCTPAADKGLDHVIFSLYRLVA